jgi:hypothetical protein
MKRIVSIVLSTAAICAFVSMTPAVAQVAGNPGDIHTRTLYMMEHDQGAGQFAIGPNTGLPAFLAPGGAPNCGVVQDFNGRYTSVCGL